MKRAAKNFPRDKNNMLHLTELSKFLRKIRIDHNERLKDMALKLNVSPSFLSQIERGGKIMPKSLVNLLIEKYRLTKTENIKLKQIVFQSCKTFTIRPKSAEGKILSGLLIYKIDELTSNQLNRIISIINE